MEEHLRLEYPVLPAWYSQALKYKKDPEGQRLYLYERLTCVALFDRHIIMGVGRIRDYGNASAKITLVNETYWFLSNILWTPIKHNHTRDRVYVGNDTLTRIMFVVFLVILYEKETFKRSTTC